MKRYIKSSSELRQQLDSLVDAGRIPKDGAIYYVTNDNYIPLHAQPAEGYTKLEAIQRAQREVRECVKLFGGRPEDYTSDFHVIDQDFNRCPELDRAI